MELEATESASGRLICSRYAAMLGVGLRRFRQQLRQLGDVRGDAPSLISGEQLGRSSPAGLLLEIEVGERVAAMIADDEAGVGSADHRAAGPERYREPSCFDTMPSQPTK